MTILRQLLAATDLSVPARHAAMRAGLLSKELDIPLDLLHVVGRGSLDKLRRFINAPLEEAERQVIASARDETQRVAELLYARQGVNAGVHVVSGPILDTLIERADASRTDLMVVGARGASFMRHSLLGSTAERMIRKARQPILVVKHPPHEQYRHVLVPIDFSAASLRALQLACAIAPNALLILLHVFDVPFESKLHMAGIEEEHIQRYRIIERQESLERLHQLAMEADIPPERITLFALRGDPWFSILEQEQEHDIDLIVMGKHGANRIEELLLGSVTKHVLAQSQCDVLISL